MNICMCEGGDRGGGEGGWATDGVSVCTHVLRVVSNRFLL